MKKTTSSSDGFIGALAIVSLLVGASLFGHFFVRPMLQQSSKKESSVAQARPQSTEQPAPAAPKPAEPPKPEAPKVQMADYTVRYVDTAGKEVHRVTKQGKVGRTIDITADDLFDKGYELLDTSTRMTTPGKDSRDIVFKVGKARELMSLTEFLRQPVDYDHPLKYRNLDFTGRQDDLEDFVIKMIYQGEKSTGEFYGTKEQADNIRKTLLNGSFQGAYARYVTNFRPSIPRLVEGDKYAMSIDFTYQEHLEDIKLGEEKITEFVSKYGTDYTDAEKAKLIHDWLMTNGKLFDPPHTRQEWFYNTKNIRRVHFPASLMLDGEGVCLTYAMTYGRLAERMGLEVRLIQGYNGLNDLKRAAQAQQMFDNPDSTTYHPGFLNHTWNIVKIDRAWHHIDTFQDKVLLQFTKKNPDPYHHFLKEEDFFREHKVKMGTNRLREYTVNRAWNTHRIPAAPTAKNEFKVMRDRSEKDI